ncbi:hypothetical protein CP995_07105 [Klebsiella pneumoniae]|nr:hypothetical protein CP995_07105 [Klebsiella pneumoniae]
MEKLKINDIFIENFRNIKEGDLKLTNYNIILSKNNQGKSNIMKAIKRGWDLINEYSLMGISATKLRSEKGYKIRTYGTNNSLKEVGDDFTINKNDKSKPIIISYKFELDNDEKENLKSLLNTKTIITNEILIQVQYNELFFYKVKVKLNINGRFLNSVTNIRESVIFILKKFDIDFIPSIRTEEAATEIVQEAVKKRLKDLSMSDEYNKAIKIIKELQKKELEIISSQIEPDLKRYLSNIESVEVVSMDNKRSMIRYGMGNDIDINIDDGILTSIKNKGDGIKSLIALSILQTSSSSNRLLMIDEPESHLHSGAIRELKSKIISDTNIHQILISTHHQIFVDRNNIENNKILNDGKIKKEKIDMRAIRKELGVSLGENLLSAESILLVEGATDKRILEQYISIYRTSLQTYLDNGKFVIDYVQGVKNLENKLSFYESGLCQVFCLLDNDSASKDLENRANIKYIPLHNKYETEIEDIFEEEFIFSVIDRKFKLDNSYKRKALFENEKFTNGLERLFDTYGERYTKAKEESFKWQIISDLEDCDDMPIKNYYKEFFDSFFTEIEQDIKKLSK